MRKIRKISSKKKKYFFRELLRFDLFTCRHCVTLQQCTTVYTRVYIYKCTLVIVLFAPPTSVVHNRNVFFCCYLLLFFFLPHEGEITSLPTSHNISVCWDPNHTLILRWKQKSLHEFTDRALIRHDVQYYYVTYIVIV
jgi:hypothetical protein